MAKHKALTPQELYRLRKQREEEEEQAYLPPGLINHGNTCFMNSVLQGLIATRLLDDLTHFNSIPPQIQEHSSIPLLSRRSPLLTNGHNLGGQFEQKWADTMPIGDMFLSVMYKAWQVQSHRRRESLSPKPILSALGRKYDQYLDFAQQDAHEFLRILLDAMRMEEFDVIKKRQPPPSQNAAKKRRRTTITPSHLHQESSSNLPETPVIPEEDRLMSLPDMIFGGKLTSILVCQKCKNVSQTYEDFNDISLSIKAEDYHERKRDRLKNLAKRLATFPTTSLSVGSEIPRPSSVPPSPREREIQPLEGHEKPPTMTDPRRSLDIIADFGKETESERSTTSKEDSTSSDNGKPGPLTNETTTNGDKHIAITDPIKPQKKGKKDEGWAKIGRRISMTVGLGKGFKERSSRSKDRASRDFSVSNSSANLHVPTPQMPNGRTSEELPQSTPRTSTSDAHTPSILLSRPSTPPNPSSPDHITSPHPPSPHRRASPPLFPPLNRSKSPKPPKPSAAELEYLRQILADITPSSNPFTLFKPTYHHQNSSNRSVTPGTPSMSAQSLWLNMTQHSGIEECLRMFTAVEILDGENMVGCRRCWKIANGAYQSKDKDLEGDEDSDSVDHSSALPPVVEPTEDTLHSLPPSLARPTVAHLPISMSTPTVSFYAHPDEGNRSVSSLPSDVVLAPANSVRSSDSIDAPHTPQTPGNLPIPHISTTPPAPSISRPLPPIPRTTSLPASRPLPSNPILSPLLGNANTPATHPTPRLGQILSHIPQSDSMDSLPVPKPRRQAKPDIESTDDSSGEESEASVATSRSIDSSATSAGQHQPSPNMSHPQQGQYVQAQAQLTTRKPKPVIMRPAYKRYLIGTPPPVLVIHLKRFQQISKTHMLSFSHGFRKLDDYVTFPEMLDLTPYLAPKREDFGLGKKTRHGKKRTKEGDKCIYRLYAVVVHIGNMLGGHYIAYTALPTPPPSTEKASTLNAPGVHVALGDPGQNHGRPSQDRPWAYISDTMVRLATLEEVLKAKAYLCMYERI